MPTTPSSLPLSRRAAVGAAAGVAALALAGGGHALAAGEDGSTDTSADAQRTDAGYDAARTSILAWSTPNSFALRPVVAAKPAPRTAAAAPSTTSRSSRRVPLSASSAPTGSPRAIAMALLPAFGWSSSQFSCVDSIFRRESGWNPYARNRSSGAYGLGQALPGSKMASVGSDWRTNPATQIKWAYGYMKSRYGSPCGAASFWNSHHWY